VAATSSKISGSYLLWSGRGGSFKHRLIGDLNEPPRLRPPKDASQYFLNGRIHPAFYQGGEFGRWATLCAKPPEGEGIAPTVGGCPHIVNLTILLPGSLAGKKLAPAV